jgi:hypothetical protein
MWRALRDHPVMVTLTLLFLAGGLLLVAPFFIGKQQRVSLLKKKDLLMTAYREFTNTGSLKRFSGDVWPSSNTVAIGNTQYQCSLELRHGGGTLAITTNSMYIWLGPTGEPKIIPTDY